MTLGGAVATALVSLILLSLTHAQSLRWERVVPEQSSPRPPPRRYSALAWNATALYLFGGQTADGSILDDTWKFSLFNNTWEQLVNLVERPAARYGFVSGVVGKHWYISHGRNETSVFNDTWAFSLHDEHWIPVNTSGAPPSSSSSSGSIPQSRFFAAGGSPVTSSTTGLLWLAMGQNGAQRKLGDTWALSINTSEPNVGVWRLVSGGVGLNQYNPTLPHARTQAAGMAVGEDRFVISGGCASGGQAGGPCPLDDTWVLHLSNGSWEQLSSCAVPRYSSSLAPLHQQLPDVAVIVGGAFRGPGVLAQVSLGGGYSPVELLTVNVTSQRWGRMMFTNTTDFPPALSSPHLAVGARGVYMFGGETADSNTLTSNLWLLTGTVMGSTLPCSTDFFSLLHLHGIIMYVAFGLLLPFGALLGRYYRWSWPIWFIGHVICQVFGTLLTVCGVVLVFLVSKEPSFPHAVIGIVLTLIVLQQFLTGIIRPWSRQAEDDETKDQYGYQKRTKMSQWRKCWKVYHSVSGAIAVAMGFAQVTLGVFLIVAPLIVWATWASLLGVWVAMFLVHEVVYYCCIRCSKKL